MAGNNAAGTSGLRYDPEYWKIIEPSQGGGAPFFNDLFELRNFSEKAIYDYIRADPWPDSIVQTKFEVVSADGTKISISRFASKEQMQSTEPLPAALHVHGGGFFSCSVEILAPAMARMAAESGVQMFAPEYRLAPEHPAPKGLEDCYAALEFVSSHAAELGVDPARVAVFGDSAGGGLAMGVALMARDRALSPPLAKQVLVYPMLDDRTRYPPDARFLRFITFQVKDNDWAWDAYLGAGHANRLDTDVPPYAVPARAADVGRLPSTYIDVGTLDLFRDDIIAMVARLVKADVEVEFHLYPGLPHGFESVKGAASIAKARENRIRALQTF